MYCIKYVDEYGKTHWFRELDDESTTTFETVEEAEEKINQLLSDEFEMFDSALADYYVVSVEESVVKGIDHLTTYVDEEGQLIVISANADKTDEMDALIDTLKENGCSVVYSKEYANKSKLVHVAYTDEEVLKLLPDEEETEDLTVDYDESVFVLKYGEDYFEDVQTATAIMTYKYKDLGVICTSLYKEDKWYTYITFDEGLVESHEDEIIETLTNLMNNKFDIKSEE